MLMNSAPLLNHIFCTTLFPFFEWEGCYFLITLALPCFIFFCVGRLLLASPRSISFSVRLLPFAFTALGALIETTMLSALFGSLVDHF
jgi:hypothetical protein